MDDNGKTLTTTQFSQMTGIAVSTITRMLRQEVIRSPSGVLTFRKH
ncbi:MAG: hypothetical protein KFF68_15545 [Desulfosarcina sp.]|nr:hypothetical protein [Desulfosarcina sp.]